MDFVNVKCKLERELCKLAFACPTAFVTFLNSHSAPSFTLETGLQGTCVMTDNIA